MKKEKCLETSCQKCNYLRINDYLIIPFEEGPKEINRILTYFLYSAPCIESLHAKNIPKEKHDDIFEKMICNRHFKYKNFCNFNSKIEKELLKGFLQNEDICIKCKRFVCKRKRPVKNKENETDLECFLRHIRNAIAHGRVYYVHGGNRVHIMFEDKNTTDKISARIVCIKADLEYWEKVLKMYEERA